MKTLIRVAAVALLVTPFQVRAPAAEPAPPRSVASIHDMAEPLPEIPGAPRASAVCMRSLTARPAHKGDPHDTLAAIRGFHATRLEWTYGDNPEFIKKVHALGVEYGGALAAGADVIQRDEPEQNMLAVQWGGCLCRHCIAGFRAWLERNANPQELAKAGVTDLALFDYAAHLRAKNAPSGDAFRRWPEGGLLRDYFKQFQLEASVAFHQRWRAELDKQAGRRIAVSCNNGARDWGPVRLPFDFCIGELAFKEATPTHLHECMRQARAHDRLQTVTMPLKTVASPAEQESADWILLTRQSIATAYALGGLIEMPWDTFLPDAQRYFGKPEHYADLTAFVRGIAPHLDGHAEAFATGCAVEDARWKGMTPPLALGDAAPHVLAVVRTLPGSPAAAAAIHLVDWRDEPQPFSITVQTDLFFGKEPATLRLLQPVAAYDRAAHDKAFDSRDYSPLVRSMPLAISADGTVALPALAPWGVVIVEKQGKPH
jgi:hypothetical protein